MYRVYERILREEDLKAWHSPFELLLRNLNEGFRGLGFRVKGAIWGII